MGEQGHKGSRMAKWCGMDPKQGVSCSVAIPGTMSLWHQDPQVPERHLSSWGQGGVREEGGGGQEAHTRL